MKKIRKYFDSFDSFLGLIYSLKINLNLFYYRYFRWFIRKEIQRNVNIWYQENSLSNRIKELLSIPSVISEDIDNAESTKIISQANLILKGIFNLLGSGDVNLNPVDWHSDFKTGFRWKPGIFYKDYIQESIESNSDVKVPRELSRCHHLLRMGLAYQITGNEKYANFCIKQIDNWIYENPLMRSINWGCTMDVAIRAVNWIWSLGLLSGWESPDKIVIDRIANSLYEHGWFIYRNPEKNKYNSHNHYLADLAGQIHLGLLFSPLKEPLNWLEKGKKELFREIRLQILPTGMSYERSTNYNRLVFELIIVPILLLDQNGHEIPQDIRYRIEKMVEFIMFSLKPDGNSPIIGDQDDARLLPLGTESNTDYRYILSLGAILFNRSDFKKEGNGFNLYCLLFCKDKAKEAFKKISGTTTNLTSKAFPDAGIYIMRKGNNYLLFNATGKGLYPELGTGTHTHSDLFSFDLCVNGKSFLVDPGSYVYTANATERMLFRSTMMHNTVTVDGLSQNNIYKEILWNFERNAIPQIIRWESTEVQDMIVCSHTGYLRLNEPVKHKRSVIFNKNKLLWQIVDEMSGKGTHTFEWYFHFDTGIDFVICGNIVKTQSQDNNNIIITFSGNDHFSLRKDKSFISKAYGAKDEGFVLIASINSICPVGLTITISQLVENETNF